MDSFKNGNQDNSSHQNVQVPTPISGVSNCYVFKSQLQEYVQKVGLATPIYETIREGPSHQPSFKSTVIVDGARYDSLPGFFNRKAAEQSAAEIALRELAKNNVKDAGKTISVPVHETGLCKNLLQEYAQKMNYAIPTYSCEVDNTGKRCSTFTCTVDIGGIQYIGGTARNKKEAEIKAARTALLAIQSNGFRVEGENVGIESAYTVVPGKRKEPEKAHPQPEPPKSKKLKKSRFKKKKFKKSHPVAVAAAQIKDGNMAEVVASKEAGHNLSDVQVPNSTQIPHGLTSAPQENVNVAEVIASKEAVCNLSDVQVPNSTQTTHGSTSTPPENGNMAEAVASKEAGCNLSDVQVPNSTQATQGLTSAPPENVNMAEVGTLKEAVCNLSDVQVSNSAQATHGLTSAPLENVNMAEVGTLKEAVCNLSDVQVPNSAQATHGLTSAPPENVNMAEVGTLKEAVCNLSDVEVPNSAQTTHGLTSAPQENVSSNANQTN